jgi:TolB-like protein
MTGPWKVAVARAHASIRRGMTALAACAGVAAAACHPSPGSQTPSPVADTTGRAAVATEAGQGAVSSKARTIGVLPFTFATSDSAIAPLSYGLADLLMTDLSRSAQLTVVDRLRLESVVREVRLASTGLVDSGSAPRAGRLMGARQLVLGGLASEGGGGLLIDARVADVGSGRIRPALTARAPLASILDAEKALTLELFNDLGIVLTPAEMAAVEQRPTKSIPALLAYSRAVRDEVNGDRDGAARQYRQAIALDPGFRLARERLTETQTGETVTTLSTSSTRPSPVALLSGGLVNQVNAVQLSPLAADAAGPADASFPLSLLVTLFITVDVP